MNATSDEFNTIASAIQLALSPCLLLTAIAAILNIIGGSLARITDKGTQLAAGATSEEDDAIRLDLARLERRRHFTSIAFTACTISALLVCLVVAALFIEVMLGIPLQGWIGAVFTLSVLTLVVGMSFFLGDLHLAPRSIRAPVPPPTGGLTNTP